MILLMRIRNILIFLFSLNIVLYGGEKMKTMFKGIIVLLLIHFLYTKIQIPKINLLTFNNKSLTINKDIFDTNQLVHTTLVQNQPLNIEMKKIYIYNTHQHETYMTNSVMDGADYLKKLLEDRGYYVVYETSNFNQYKIDHHMDLTETYPTSRIFLERNINEYGPFDLIIDYHRDALLRDQAVYSNNDISYAKLMMVIGGASGKSNQVLYNSNILHNEVEKIMPGIMRSDFFRETAIYNQDYTERMLLIEVGGHQNYYNEITNSLEILAQAIDNCLKEDKFQ